MRDRSRSTFLLGCFGVAVLYLPDCARILAGQEVAVVHAGAPLEGFVGTSPPAAMPAPAADRTVAAIQKHDYVGGE